MPVRPLPRLVLAPVAFVLLAIATARAQIPKLPGIPGMSPASQAATVPTAQTPSVAGLAEELKQIHAKLADTKVPEGIGEDEVAAYRADLRRAIFNLERQIGVIEAASDEPPDPPPANDAPAASAAGGPVSFLRYDTLRDKRDDEAAKLEAQQASVRLLQDLQETQQGRLRAATTASQAAADQLKRSLKQPGEAAAVWRLNAAKAAVQAAASNISYIEARLSILQPAIKRSTAALEQLRDEIAAMAPRVEFRAADLAAVDRDAAEKTARLEEEFSPLGDRRNSLLAERERLQREIDGLKQSGSGATEPQTRSEVLAGELAAADAELRAATTVMELLAFLGRIHNELAASLRDMHQIMQGPAQERVAAQKRLVETRSQAQSWLTFAESQRVVNNAAIAGAEAALAAAKANSPEHENASRVLAAAVRTGKILERVHLLGTQAVRRLDRWLADCEEILARRSLGRRISDVVATVWSSVKAVWAFPVYHYSDAVEVGGQTIKVSRGLSLGRLLGALVFLVVAHRMAVFIIRRIQRGLRVRHWGNAAMFPTLRRWTMVAVDSLLVLFTLHLLEIPLTAFAFLGGALAIGFGFGTQTIFKNLISGLIVLGERKIKVGDILEVDGFTGRVTSVDTRSSILRGFDGVETLVPNSMLLENRVTNWTMSNPRQRRTVRVGVAYGSPVQRATAILGECADRHGLVLKDPAPLVMLEDFAADALLLGLYFWVELSESTNASQIASDLRFMIEKRFGEAGIVIAYPQRDVHLTTPGPIPVRMVGEPQDTRPAPHPPADGKSAGPHPGR